MPYMLVCSNYRSIGVEGEKEPGSRLRLGGDTIEMSDDNEISVVLEDVGDREATEEDDAGDEGAAKKRCGDESKREGSDDGNDVNDNVWSHTGMQARSYHRKLSIWKKLVRGEGQIFQSAEAFWQMICKYAIANHFNNRFDRNCSLRVVVRCDAADYPFYICVRGGKNTPLMLLKIFRGQHVHSVGEQCHMGIWGRRRVRAELLMHLIKGKVHLCLDTLQRTYYKIWSWSWGFASHTCSHQGRGRLST